MATVASSTFLAIVIALHAGAAAKLSLDDPLDPHLRAALACVPHADQRGRAPAEIRNRKGGSQPAESEGPPSPARKRGGQGVDSDRIPATGADSGAGNAADPIPEVDHEPRPA